MARGLSNRIAALAAVAGCLLAAAASVPQRPCEAEDGRCPSAAGETDEGDQASLLARMVATKAHGRAAAAEAAAAGANGTAKCNEAKYQGLCYRTCTDMGEMEPRRSISSCGGVQDYSFLQRCNEDGTSSVGAGSAPGLMGRPTGGCFGDDSKSHQAETAPNMCTTDCKRGAPTTKVSGSSKKFCCADGESTPQADKTGDELICSCSLGTKPPMPWLPEPMGVLKTTPGKACNTGCSKAAAWLMVDSIAYCCPGNGKPTAKKLPGPPGHPDYTVQCSCP